MEDVAIAGWDALKIPNFVLFGEVSTGSYCRRADTYRVRTTHHRVAAGHGHDCCATIIAQPSKVKGPKGSYSLHRIFGPYANSALYEPIGEQDYLHPCQEQGMAEILWTRLRSMLRNEAMS